MPVTLSAPTPEEVDPTPTNANVVVVIPALYAPSILEEEVNNWFDLDYESPYMLIVADVKIILEFFS